jgi:hypothetical protein
MGINHPAFAHQKRWWPLPSIVKRNFDIWASICLGKMLFTFTSVVSQENH